MLFRSDAFPSSVGTTSNVKLTNPALELVKSICHILSLDIPVEEEVDVLRKLLLRQIGIAEFSSKAQFTNYATSFILPDVICDFCNYCRDVDICRDTLVLAEDINDRWRCPECMNSYDLATIEQQIIKIIEMKMMN